MMRGGYSSSVLEQPVCVRACLRNKRISSCVLSMRCLYERPHQTRRLTCVYLAFILCSLSQKTRVRAATPCNGQNIGPLLSVVFLRPSKSNAALIRVVSIMVDCVGQLLIELVGTVTDCCNPMQSATQYLQLLRGGYPLHNGVTA
jgi:hypothetical protein